METQRRRERRGAEDLNLLTQAVIGAAVEVHRELGPGLLESVYEVCLEHELIMRGVAVQRQVRLPLVYRGLELEVGYRIDLFVADEVVVEVKAVEKLQPIHEAQLLTYLRLSDSRIGLLINFNTPLLKWGLKRVVHRFPPPSPGSAPLRPLRLCVEDPLLSDLE